MYSIEQLSMITGLTTRTLRNYLKSELLKGSKETGAWQFTEEQVSEFMTHPAVRPSIQAKRHAIVYDFLADQDQSENELCILLHHTLGKKEAGKIADFFCEQATELNHVRFSYAYEAGKARYILKGAEAEIGRVMAEFYRQAF